MPLKNMQAAAPRGGTVLPTATVADGTHSVDMTGLYDVRQKVVMEADIDTFDVTGGVAGADLALLVEGDFTFSLPGGLTVSPSSSKVLVSLTFFEDDAPEVVSVTSESDAQSAVGIFDGAMPFANRTMWGGEDNATDTATASTTYRVRHVALTKATGVSVVLGNHRGIIGGANAIDVNCSIELGDGTILPLYFAGNRTPKIEIGQFLISDPHGWVPEAGEVFWTRTWVRGAGGAGSYPIGMRLRGASYSEGSGAGDLTLSGAITNGTGSGYAPVAIIAQKRDPELVSVGLIGDSIMRGHDDQTDEAVDDDSRGFAVRSLGDTHGVVRTARGGVRVAERMAAGRKLFPEFIAVAPCDYVLCNHGITDLRNGRTLAQLQADLIALWTRGRFAGSTVYQTTITPTTNSTDSWASLGSQSLYLDGVSGRGTEADRLAVNAWLRAGAPIVDGAAVAVGTAGAILVGERTHPLSHVFDTAVVVEEAGKWIVGMTLDGLHPTPAGHIAMAAVLDPAWFT